MSSWLTHLQPSTFNLSPKAYHLQPQTTTYSHTIYHRTMVPERELARHNDIPPFVSV